MPPTESDLLEALASVQRIVNADKRDWTDNRHDAFIYGLFRGWEDPAAEDSVAQKHRWDAEFLVRIHRLHDAIAVALG